MFLWGVFTVKSYLSVAAVDVATIPDGSREHGVHAMVLDTIEDGMLIFKNSLPDNRQVAIPVDQGPLKFYYLHMHIAEKVSDEPVKQFGVQFGVLESNIAPSSESNFESDFYTHF